MTYDAKCEELAWHFLQDHQHINDGLHARALASVIQRAIEEYLRDFESAPPNTETEKEAR